MNWKDRYRLASYLRSSLWIVPIGALILERIFAEILYVLEPRLRWNGLGLGLEGARALANAVVTMTLSFITFTFGSLLIAIQIASGQYTPRIIATTLLRNNVIRYTVGLFVFAFVFAVKTLNRTETVVPQLVLFVTGLLGILCIVAFLFMIDYAARLLRPVSLVNNVGEAGLAVVDSVYPDQLVEEQDQTAPIELPSPQRTVLHRKKSAIIVAVNVQQLIDEANKSDCVIEMAPQVGDFVGRDEPFFVVHGSGEVDDQALEDCVIFGSERTLEQDPLFAFRILVDIAIKALSAAINDPTTAVLTIDQLHRLLRRVGRRDLRTDYVKDRAGNVRLILRTPNWLDFVHLAFTEIRFYGCSNIQIARRLRAMIMNLSSNLPARRQPALQEQLHLLDSMIEHCHFLPEDLALARVPDTQGLGSSDEITPPTAD
jgi:uncharacterized membrane protein